MRYSALMAAALLSGAGILSAQADMIEREVGSSNDEEETFSASETINGVADTSDVTETVNKANGTDHVDLDGEALVNQTVINPLEERVTQRENATDRNTEDRTRNAETITVNGEEIAINDAQYQTNDADLTALEGDFSRIQGDLEHFANNIPVGETGPRGDKGPRGPRGPEGDRGHHGQPSGRTGATAGSAVGGSTGMCFHPETPVCLADGSTVRIGDVRIGDRLADGSSVQMTLEFLADDLYQVGNVWVSGSHAVYEQGEWKRVRDAASATRLAVSRQRVINLVTDTHRIQASGKLFADYLEVGGAFRQSIWTNMVAKYGGVNHAMKAKASVA